MAWRYVEKVPELAETVHSGHLGFCFSGMISSPWNLNIGNLSVCSWSEKGKLRWVVFQNTPKMAVPWEAPSPLTGDITVLKHINYTQKTSGEGPCEGRSAEYWKLDEPRSPTVNGHLYGLEVRHVPWRRLCPPHTPLPPRGVTLLSSAMSQDWKSESLLSRYKEVSEGLLFPIAQVHAFHLPTRGPEKTPKFHTMKAEGYLFIIF